MMVYPSSFSQKLKKKLTVWEIVAISSQFGFLIALPVAGGTILGFFLDKKFSSTPALTIIFLLGGIFLAFWQVFKKIREIQDASH